jgi:putative salt-induced outer membrane protein YdiY
LQEPFVKKNFALIALASALAAAPALGDTVILKNGDKLTGKVGTVAGGTMEFTSPAFGKVTINMADVESFTLDAPAEARMADRGPRQQVTGGDTDSFTTAAGQVPAANVKILNPPSEVWSGSIVAGLQIARGNTNTLDASVDIAAQLRRDNEEINDRITLMGEYNFSTSGRGDESTTTSDNWAAAAKYDRFFNEKLYGYANIGVEHDRIALLNYRLTPGVGLGYQWIEQPDMNFNTEAGVTYVYEDYENTGEEDSVALRLAYHYDNKLADNLLLFHNLEYLPAFDDPGDFILRTDIGLRALFTERFFGEFKFEWQHDSTPADGTLKNDLRYVVGLGWNF